MNIFVSPKNYINFGINVVLGAFSPIIRKWEKRFIYKYSQQPLKHQPLFIIGTPRTGSTILYQTLTNLYDVLYVDNLVCRFHRNFFFGFWLTNKLYGEKPHNNFESDHGNTKGLHSPSECGHFWYRWLPKDHHFIDHDEILPETVEEIRREITAVINYFNKPIVFKNLNAGQRIRLLTRCFPSAKFLFITRKPSMTAQSILKAKRSLGLSENVFWSIMPKNINKLDKLEGFEQVVKQVYFLEKQIIDDSGLVANESFYIIQYENLSVLYIDNLAQSLGFIRRHDDTKIPDIKTHESISIDEKEYQVLQKQVEKLDWSFLPNKSN